MNSENPLLIDERGTNRVAVDPGAEIDATDYFDAELGYDYSDKLRFVLGAANVFDEYIDPIGGPNANRLSVDRQLAKSKLGEKNRLDIRPVFRA